jgi:hypothetical protein
VASLQICSKFSDPIWYVITPVMLCSPTSWLGKTWIIGVDKNGFPHLGFALLHRVYSGLWRKIA